MKKEISSVLRLSALSVALLAAGCGGGGGGGGGGDSSDDAPAASARSVSGTAAKGIIKNGVVQVYGLDAQGNKSSSPVVTGRTGADGSFTVSLPPEVLLFVVEVSAADDTIMADEATGKDIAMPRDLKLRNIVALEAGQTSFTGSVSPLTEMTARLAENAAGGLSTASIKQAKAEMISRIGFDPESVKPVNINSAEAAGLTGNERAQALILAGISKMARDGTAECAASNLNCVVNVVATAAANGGIESAVATLSNAMNAVLEDKTIDNKAGPAPVELPNKPAPAVTEEPGVESAKKLFKSLRTNLNAIADSETALEARADAVAADFDKMIAPIDDELADWFTLPTFAIDYLADYKSGKVTSNTVRPNGSQFCRVMSASDALAANAADAANILCDTRRFIYGWDPVQNLLTYRSVAHSVRIIPGTSSSTYAYRTWANGVDGKMAGNYGNNLNYGTGTITYTAGTSRSNFAIIGHLPPRFDESGLQLSDHEYWDLNARTTATGESTTYALTAQMTSWRGGVETGRLTVLDGSMLRVKAAPGIVQPHLVDEVALSVTAQSGDSAVNGTFRATDWKSDKTGALYAPAYALFSGSVKQGGVALFNGQLKHTHTGFGVFDSTQSISADNFLAQTVRLDGELAVPGRPALKMFLAASTRAAGGHDLNAQYNDGQLVINFSGTRSAAGALNSGVISTTTGIAVQLNAADIDAKRVVDVKKNDEVVATIDLGSGIVHYNDAEKTFESLK